jgi:hypothetical protein
MVHILVRNAKNLEQHAAEIGGKGAVLLYENKGKLFIEKYLLILNYCV